MIGGTTVAFHTATNTTNAINSNNNYLQSTIQSYIHGCPRNYYLQDQTCTACPERSISKESSKSFDDCICKDNMVMKEAISFTTIGTSTFGTCEQCEKGEEKINNECVKCNPGHYKDQKGSQKCTKCPINTWNSKRGSQSDMDCILCSKDRTTSNEDGMTNINDCFLLISIFIA